MTESVMLIFSAEKANELKALLPKTDGKIREYLADIIVEGEAALEPDKENDEEAPELAAANVVAICADDNPDLRAFAKFCEEHRSEYECLDEICESLNN